MWELRGLITGIGEKAFRVHRRASQLQGLCN